MGLIDIDDDNDNHDYNHNHHSALLDDPLPYDCLSQDLESNRTPRATIIP